MTHDVLSTPARQAAALFESAMADRAAGKGAAGISEASLQQIKQLIIGTNPDDLRLLQARLEALRTRLLSLWSLNKREAEFLKKLGYKPPLKRGELAAAAKEARAAAADDEERAFGEELALFAETEARITELLSSEDIDSV